MSRRWSIFGYVYDNPLWYIDPDGMLVQGHYEGAAAQEAFSQSLMEQGYQKSEYFSQNDEGGKKGNKGNRKNDKSNDSDEKIDDNNKECNPASIDESVLYKGSYYQSLKNGDFRSNTCSSTSNSILHESVLSF